MDTCSSIPLASKGLVPDYEIDLRVGTKWSRKKRSILPNTQLNVFKACDYRCVVCGVFTNESIPRDIHGRPLSFRLDENGNTVQCAGRFLTLDHIVPKKYASCNFFENLILLCSVCNNAKADMLPRHWLRTLSPHLQAALLDRVIKAEVYHVLVSE
jgi:5-methylcytosine-specific restriction endonuclease McrA